jgi:hypothetical protein
LCYRSSQTECCQAQNKQLDRGQHDDVLLFDRSLYAVVRCGSCDCCRRM